MPFMDAPEQEIEEDYRTAFELAGVGKAHVDLGTGRFTRVNAKCCEMTGNSAEEFLGMTFKDLIHPDAQAEALKDFEKFVSGKISDYSVEWPCVCKDGKTMWAVIRAKMLPSQAGQPKRMLAVIQDISTRKAAEQALLQAKIPQTDYAKELEQRVAERTAKLEETIKSLDTFCYSVAHDLRAPVRAIHGYVSMLIEQHPQQLDETGKEYLKRIMVAARHMDDLINDLLVYGRMSHLDLPLAEVDVNRILTGILENLAGEIKARKANVDVRWPLEAVWGHPNVLEQILANLIDNALKFVPAGVAPQISIWSEKAEATVRIFVKDNGIGIAPEHQERIFRIFERLNNSKEYPGTGIGLALVKKGVERLGGKVGLESKEGAGSCFWIDLIKAKPPATSQKMAATG